MSRVKITNDTLVALASAEECSDNLVTWLQNANKSTESGLLGIQLIGLIREASDLQARVYHLNQVATHEAGTP